MTTHATLSTAERDRDRQHMSDDRGEHRYPDSGQTAAEQSARLDRDGLKRRLAAAARPSDLTPMTAIREDRR